jgi:hypothetical protein
MGDGKEGDVVFVTCTGVDVVSGGRTGAPQQQEPVTATGVLQRAAPEGSDPTPVYAITDEATGTLYRLISGFVNLEYYIGQRITFQGVPVPGPDTPGAPHELNVTQVQPADAPPVSQPDTTATLMFELAVKAEPPEGTTFSESYRPREDQGAAGGPR